LRMYFVHLHMLCCPSLTLALSSLAHPPTPPSLCPPKPALRSFDAIPTVSAARTESACFGTLGAQSTSSTHLPASSLLKLVSFVDSALFPLQTLVVIKTLSIVTFLTLKSLRAFLFHQMPFLLLKRLFLTCICHDFFFQRPTTLSRKLGLTAQLLKHPRLKLM